MIGGFHLQSLGQFAQPDAEFGDHEAEAHDGDAGADPREKGTLGGEAFGGFLIFRNGGGWRWILWSHGCKEYGQREAGSQWVKTGEIFKERIMR